jgi:hypothetical protein
MIKVFDFRCTNGHVFEEFVDQGVTTQRCGCGANATKIVSATQCILDGSTGDFPGRHMKWVREHEEAGRRGREAQREESQSR